MRLQLRPPATRHSTLRSHTATLILVLFAMAMFSTFALAQDYPPYGPNVPKAHFDNGKRPQKTPPAPNLLPDGRTAQSEWNMELVGYDTLDGRSTYQPLAVKQIINGKVHYIAYMAHHAGTAHDRTIHCDTVANPNCNVTTNGTSILDVTDPRHPVYLVHIPGPAGSIDAGGNQMVHVCGGDQLPSKTAAEAARKHGHYYMLRSNGNSSGAANPGTENHQIFDVTDPAHPVHLLDIDPQETNTPKSWWECYSGVAYLVSNDSSKSTSPDKAPGWQQSGSNQHLKIYNLHDPANPEYIRDFGLVGQQPGGTTVEGLVSPPTGVHGPISAGNRIYAAYGVGGNGIVQILDRDKVLTGCTGPGASANCAKSPTQAEMLAPQKGFFTLPGTTLQGGHTSWPIFGERGGKPFNVLVVVSEEGGNECSAGSAPHAAWLYNVTDEANPKLLSVDNNDPARTRLDVPNGFNNQWIGIVPGNGAPDTHCGTTNCSAAGVYGPSVTPQDTPPQPKNNFCNQGARFGAHASQELFYPPYYGRLAIVSWFVGGVRVFDMRNPDEARQVAYFIPAPNDTGCGVNGGPSPGLGCTMPNSGRDGHTVRAIHTNNVEVDARGFIYIADRAGTGMHILRLTGEARAAAEGEVEANEGGDQDKD
jgi:hypothetical protein